MNGLIFTEKVFSRTLLMILIKGGGEVEEEKEKEGNKLVK